MSTSVTIFIMDDDFGFRKTLHNILKARGYAPMSFATGSEALKVAEEKTPAVALIDLKLEDMSGLEVLRGIKERSPGTECILLTGYASQASAVEAVNLGAYGYLQKPYAMDQLLLTIRRAVEKHETARALRESEERYRSIVEHSHAGIFIVDDTYKFTYVNDELCRILNRSRQEIVSHDFREFLDDDSRELVAERYVRRQRGEKVPSHYEFNIVHPDGEKRRVEISSNTIRDAAGKVKTIAQILDITKRKQAEEALRQSEQLLTDIFESIQDGISVLDPDLTIRHVNGVMKRWYSENLPLEGKKCFECYHNSDRPCDPCPTLRCIQSRKTERDIVPGLEGSPVEWIELFSFPMQDPGSGEVTGVVEFVRDVTEQVRAEDEIHRRAERLAAVNRVARAVSATLELDELLETVSREVASIFQPDAFFIALYDEETNELDFRIRMDQGIRQPTDRQPLGVGLVSRVVGEKQPLLVRNFEQEKDHLPEVRLWGTMKAAASWLGVPMRTSGRVTGAISVQAYRPHAYGEEEQQLLTTIADQVAIAVENARLYHETQQRLTELMALHQTTLDITTQLETPRLLDAIIERAVGLVGATGGLILLYDPAAEHLVVVTSLSLEKDYTGLSLRVGEGGAGRAFQSGEPLIVANHRTWDGRSPQVADADARSLICVPLKWQDQVIGVLDIMDNARVDAFGGRDLRLLEPFAAQAAIAIQNTRLLEQTQQQAHQMQQIMQTVPDGVLLLDAESRVILVNPVAEGYLAVLNGSAVGQVLTHLGDHPLAELLTSPPKGLWHEVTAENRIFEVIARPIEDGPGSQGWVLVIRDVTQGREVQRRLQQQERLAAVGQLAAGIAHDFNNILGVITLYTQMELNNPNLPPKTRKHLETAAQQANLASKLIRQILDFSRRAVLERRPMDLTPFLKEQVKLLEHTLPENIKIKLDYGHDEYTIHADPTRIQQVFLNLAVNARDALPAGGALQFGLERVRVENSKHAPLPEMTVGEWVRITVADTGTGIPPEVLPHIFEPFFTTKGPGKGSGLGLAQVHGIIKQHGGHVDVTSKPGAGTTFMLYLPALVPQKAEPLPATVTGMPQGRGETILAVEDNATLQEALADNLELLNYRVLAAANGREALSILEQHPEVALVLSDLVMPEMGGQALFQALKQRGSTLPMVILSGHPLEDELESMQAQGLAGWLPKPLNVEQLAQLLARVLTGVEMKRQAGNQKAVIARST